MPEAGRMTFWSWYRHSARIDGRLVSTPRRVLGASIVIAALVSWYVSISHSQRGVADIILRLARTHPFCFLGIVLSFALLGWRGVALEYLAYSVYRAQGIHLKWVLFFGIRQDELRRRYQEAFGKDTFLRAPALCAGLSMLIFAGSALALIFARQ